METTAKQKQASRKNGALGGVKTEAGKGISSMNAMRHGILANCITKYDWLDLETVYAQLAEEFGDTTPSRRFLIQQLALTTLRLARCARAETELLKEAINPPVTEVRKLTTFDFEETVVINEGDPALINPGSLERFALIYERYEPKLVSRFLQIIAALKDKQPE